MFKKITAIATIAAIMVTGAVIMTSDVATADRANGNKPIYPLAKEAGLTTLVAAVKAAGLQGTLAGKGPFTVFAPTNEAFAALGTETLNAVLADKALLTDILLYHVAIGELYAADVLSRSTIEMANGESISVDAANVRVNSSGIAVPNVKAGNGVVHVIDTVLLPSSVTNALTINKSMRINGPQLNATTAEPNAQETSWGELKSIYR